MGCRMGPPAVAISCDQGKVPWVTRLVSFLKHNWLTVGLTLTGFMRDDWLTGGLDYDRFSEMIGCLLNYTLTGS